MDLGLDSPRLAHDSRGWILLLGSCSKKVRTLAHMAVINVNSHRIIPGMTTRVTMLTIN